MGICIEKIKELMKSRSWCASELARRMGVSRSEVTRLLSGKRQGGTKIVAGLKQAFPDEPLESLFYFPLMSPIVNAYRNDISQKERSGDCENIPIKHPNVSQLACTLNKKEGVIRIVRGKYLTIIRFPPGQVSVKHTQIEE